MKNVQHFRCLTCGFTSVRFDPFSSLSLPLPENENVIIEVFVIPLNPASNIVKVRKLWILGQFLRSIRSCDLSTVFQDPLYLVFCKVALCWVYLKMCI